MKVKRAYILNSLEDSKLIKTHGNKYEYIYLNYQDGFLYKNQHGLLYKNQRIKYFSDYFFTSESMETIGNEISRKWFRDNNGKDIFNNNISIGMLLEWHLGDVLSGIIRYYITLKNIVDSFDEVLITNKSSMLLTKVAIYFPNKVTFLESTNIKQQNNKTYSLKNTEKHTINIQKKSIIARLLQKPIKRIVQNKTLVFYDWTLKKQKNKQFLYSNSYNIFKGFYLKNINDKSIYNTSFVKIDYALIQKKVLSIIYSFSLHDKQLAELISEVIIYEYYLIEEESKKALSIYSELFEYYSPLSVVISSTTNPWHCLIMQIANLKSIPVLISIDGYQTFIDKYEFYKNRTGDGLLIKNYATMGDTGARLFNKRMFKSVNKIQIKPPLLNLHVKKHRGDKFIMILFPYPRLANVNTKLDYRFKYVIDIIKLIKTIGSGKIFVKFKEADPSNDSSTLKQMIDIMSYNNITIGAGPLYDYIQKAEFIIGGYSSAIIEAAYNDIPFYIYEPHYNGMRSNIIEGAIIHKKDVSRTIKSLENKILDKLPLYIDKQYLSNGTNLSEINFNQFIL